MFEVCSPEWHVVNLAVLAAPFVLTTGANLALSGFLLFRRPALATAPVAALGAWAWLLSAGEEATAFSAAMGVPALCLGIVWRVTGDAALGRALGFLAVATGVVATSYVSAAESVVVCCLLPGL